MAFILSSPAFENGSRIPTKYTCDGEDVSPPLRWVGATEGARSFALLCADPDAPRGTWWHWAVYDIATDEAGLPEAYPKGWHVGACRQAVNDFGYSGYGGPCPPIGRHRYFHKLYALDTILPDLGKPTKVQLEKAMAGHILTKAEIIGLYQR